MYVCTYQHDPGLGRAVLDHVQELGQGVHIVLHSRVKDRQVDGVLFEEQRDGVGIDRLTCRVPSSEVDLTYSELGHIDAVGHRGALQELVQFDAVEKGGLTARPIAHQDKVGSVQYDLTRRLQLHDFMAVEICRHKSFII